jgi:hypothetical protein
MRNVLPLSTCMEKWSKNSTRLQRSKVSSSLSYKIYHYFPKICDGYFILCSIMLPFEVYSPCSTAPRIFVFVFPFKVYSPCGTSPWFVMRIHLY